MEGSKGYEVLDGDVVQAMTLCKALRLTVHVRGSDEHPVVQFRGKASRREVGGIELRRRLEEYHRGFQGT